MQGATVQELLEAQCGVYLLSGDYDHSVPPEAAAEIAQTLGCYFKKMPGLGHFPMSENPTKFKRHLQPPFADKVNVMLLPDIADCVPDSA